jgi:hypothetical protein
MSAPRAWLRRGWRRLRLRLLRRRRIPVRGLALAGFAVLVAAIVVGTVVGLDAGRGGVLFSSLVGLFTVATVLRPEGVAGTVVLLLVVAAYLYGTTLAAVRPAGLAVLGLAVTLYLAHALVALAAAVPPGATVERAVLRRWLRRLGEVVAVTVPLGLLAPLLERADAPAAVRVLGYVAVVALIAVVVAYGRGRAPWRDSSHPSKLD